jgi:hypothetical protein
MGRPYLVFTEFGPTCLDALNKIQHHRQMITLIPKQKESATWKKIVKDSNCRRRGPKDMYIYIYTGSYDIKRRQNHAVRIIYHGR